MMKDWVPKGEKTSRTRGRLRHCVMLLFMIGILMLLIYSSGLEEWLLNRSHQYLTTPARNISTPQQISTPQEISAPQESMSRYFVAYPHHYNYILDEPNRCRQESPFLVLIIPVTANNVEARNVIRHTWGKEATVQGQVVHHYFLLGRSKEGKGTEQVLSESQKHHDVIQSDFVDSYNNLTIKTMVMFEWLSTHCPKTSYAMKVDSDVFLNVPKLIDMLLKAPRHDYLTGLMIRGASVFRDRNSKWFLPASVYPESTYPPYPMGLGYAFSLDLSKKMLEASAHVKAIYIEDVFLGLCMRHLGVVPTDPPPGALFRYILPPVKSKCYWNSLIIALLDNSKQLLDVWKTYQNSAESGC